MAITTIDGVLAGMQQPRDFTKSATPTLVAGRPHSLFYLGGQPAAAAAPTPGIGGANLTTYAGQIPYTNPGAGNSYLAQFQGQATQGGVLLLCDRLWHNSGVDVTLTTQQLFTGSTTIPSRDSNGAALGDGVYAAVEVTTATGVGTPTLTFQYTDNAGNAGVTATNIDATVATSAIGAFYRIGLSAGTTGVRKAEALTLSTTWTSGLVSVVLYRIIARLPLTSANIGNNLDAISAGFPRIYDNSVPFLVFVPNTTSTSIVSGNVSWTQG